MERNRHLSIRITQCIVVLLLIALAIPVAAASTFPQSTFDTAGPVAKMQADLFHITLWISVFIFVVVGVGLTIAMIRFRRRPNDPEPPQIEGNAKLEVIWTVIPVILLLFIAVPTVGISLTLGTTPDDAIDVRVVGYQWWWAFEYPDHGIVTANEVRIPVGKPVNFLIESEDVIHSFWVPRLGGKMDAVPGRVNEMWLQADEPGIYYGQCAEYCGTSHANMRLRVHAVPQDEFDAWIQERQAMAATQLVTEDPLVDRGREVFMTTACAACHTVDGTSAVGKVGPDLSDIGGRVTLAAGMIDNTPENMAAWIRDPQAIKPGALMPKVNLNEQEIEALVAFLEVLN